MKLVVVQIAIAAATAVTLGACGSAPNGSETTGAASAAVINGTPVTAGTLGSAILYYCASGVPACLASQNATSGCSGTMVADGWFLTAQHCVTENEAYTGGIAYDVGDVFVESSDATTHADAVAIYLHPTLDVALVQLSGSIKSGGTNYCTPVYTGSTSGFTGQNLYCEGFGSSQDSDPTALGTLRSAVLTVASVSPSVIFVDPNADQQILSPGDSGGGCFLYAPGAGSPNAIVATCSREDVVGGAGFTPYDNQLMSADGFESWEMSIIAAANCGTHCGILTDACGAAVSCGGCPSGETCGAANYCEITHICKFPEVYCNRSHSCVPESSWTTACND